MPALPTPGNTLTSEDDGTAAGLGGVEFYRDGKEGVLPGFPTAGGMGILIADRVNDDRLRSEAGELTSSTSLIYDTPFSSSPYCSPKPFTH